MSKVQFVYDSSEGTYFKGAVNRKCGAAEARPEGRGWGEKEKRELLLGVWPVRKNPGVLIPT